MRTLYYFWLSPACHKIRILLGEKKLSFEKQIEYVEKRRLDFLRLNPAGDVPVLVIDDTIALSCDMAIAEFLNESHPDPDILGTHPLERAEARRLVHWFDAKFFSDVVERLLMEKITKRLLKTEYPNSQAIRASLKNSHDHFEYMTYLLEKRSWIAGSFFSLADITAAAHISVIDYIGDVPWKEYPVVHEWYARIKSRPSMKDILSEDVPGIHPPKHYSNPDF